MPFIFEAQAQTGASGSPSAARTPRCAPAASGPPPRRVENLVEAGEHSAGLEVDHATPRLPCDVIETRAAFFMRFDCAGAEREAVKLDVGRRARDVRVSVHRLRGKAAVEEEKAKGNSYVSIERPMGASTRRVVLPTSADFGAIESGLVDGMLLVKVPKLASAMQDAGACCGRRRIPVTA